MPQELRPQPTQAPKEPSGIRFSSSRAQVQLPERLPGELPPASRGRAGAPLLR